MGKVLGLPNMGSQMFVVYFTGLCQWIVNPYKGKKERRDIPSILRNIVRSCSVQRTQTPLIRTGHESDGGIFCQRPKDLSIGLSNNEYK